MKKETAHFAIMPSPGMGHFIPMVELAKRLVSQHNLTATLLVLDSGLHSNNEQIKPLLQSLPPGANHILLPPPEFDESESNLRFEMRIALTIPRSLLSVRRALESLTRTTKLTALVVDFFGTAAFDVAREFDVSPYMFCPCSATALSLFMYFPKLEASHHHQPLPPLIQFPGCNLLRDEDFPFPDRQGIGYKWFVENAKRYVMAEGIMVNTFAELEGGTLKAFQNQQLNYPPILPVGPLIRMESSSSSMNTDQELLNWLDRQPPGSILFVCFGSFGLLSNAQLQELAYGIEMSKKGFVWVVRSPSGDPISILPKDFVEKTKGRGLLVTNWAPQGKILSHGSTGGFLTHCGWNSVLESVVNGVPMIAWPLYAEQKMNAAMLAEELKIALRPRPEEEEEAGGLVNRNVIAKTVNDLMKGEEGKQLRRRVRELKDAAEEVVSEDGRSTRCMADLSWKWKKRTEEIIFDREPR